MTVQEMNSETRDLVKRLSVFYSGVVHDILDKLSIPGFLKGITLQGALPEDGKIVAPALTVQFRKTEIKQEQWGLLEAIDHGKDHIIVVDSDYENGAEGSVYGGLMSLGSKVNGVVGTIVNGTCRDIPEVRKIGYPLYARGIAPLSAIGRLKVTGVGVTLRICGIRIMPGDIIFADYDGAICIPRHSLQTVVELGEQLYNTENTFQQDILEGKPLLKIFEILKMTDQV